MGWRLSLPGAVKPPPRPRQGRFGGAPEPGWGSAFSFEAPLRAPRWRIAGAFFGVLNVLFLAPLGFHFWISSIPSGAVVLLAAFTPWQNQCGAA